MANGNGINLLKVLSQTAATLLVPFMGGAAYCIRNVVWKSELEDSQKHMNQSMKEMNTDLKYDIIQVKEDLKNDIKEVRKDIRHSNDQLTELITKAMPVKSGTCNVM